MAMLVILNEVFLRILDWNEEQEEGDLLAKGFRLENCNT